MTAPHLSRSDFPSKTAYNRIRKRRLRAQWRAQGLNSNRGPLVSPERQEASLRVLRVPCTCYDCLFPAGEDTYQPRVARVLR